MLAHFRPSRHPPAFYGDPERMISALNALKNRTENTQNMVSYIPHCGNSHCDKLGRQISNDPICLTWPGELEAPLHTHCAIAHVTDDELAPVDTGVAPL